MFRHPHKRMSGYPVISIQSSDYDIILRVHKLMKTSSIIHLSPKRINGNPGKIKIYSTQQSRIKEAVGWMMVLYSLMGERRKNKIRRVINDWKLSQDGRLKFKSKNYYMKKKIKNKWINSLREEDNKIFISPFNRVL